MRGEESVLSPLSISVDTALEHKSGSDKKAAAIADLSISACKKKVRKDREQGFVRHNSFY